MKTGKIYNVFRFAREAHLGQRRKNGDSYISHPVRVTRIARDHGADTEEIYAALLHDVVEDGGITLDNIAERYGKRVAFLVDGLTPLNDLEDTINKLKEYSERDKGVILIRLCDVLHNLNTLAGKLSDKSKIRHKAAVELGRMYGYDALSKEVDALLARRVVENAFS